MRLLVCNNIHDVVSKLFGRKNDSMFSLYRNEVPLLNPESLYNYYKFCKKKFMYKTYNE